MIYIGKLMLVMLLSSGSAHAINKCKIGDSVVYQDAPCLGAQKLRVDRVSEKETAAAHSRLDKEKTRGTEMAKAREISDIDYRIRDLEAGRAVILSKLDADLAKLKSRKSSANNNLAGATLEASISQEMDAVIAKANTELRVMDVRIEQANRERERLQK